MHKFILKYILLLVLFICTIYSSHAVESYNDIFEEDMVKVSFVSSITKIDNKSFYIGLKFNLDPDWKIYWRQPGDSGMPPKVDFSESNNLDNFVMKWPFPEKEYETVDLLTNVYKRNIIIPIEVTVLNKNSPLKLRGIVDFQVCKDICIPFTAYLKLNLDPGTAIYTDNYFHINKELSSVPLVYNNAGIENVEVFRIDKKRLLVNVKSLVNFPDGDFDIYAESNKNYLKINKIIKKNSSEKDIVAYLNFESDIDNIKDIYLTFVAGNLAFYSQNEIMNSSNNSKLIFILFMALMGGFILNFMPCVLPVITLKISRVLNNYNENNKLIRYNFLYSSIGIITSFIFLALMTIILKYIGIEVGWGTQFQHPIFVGFLLFILIVFTANLLNIFDINLPVGISSRINNFIDNKSHSTSFFEGAFATLLATPCSAPFLGTAVGFALSTDVISIILVFSFLGLGMSVPYLLVSFFPNIISIFPRPGVWINYLRYILAIGLALTALWLLGIFISLIGWQYSAIFISITLSTLLFFHLKISYSKFAIIFLSIISIFILVNIISDNYNFKNNNNKSHLTWEEFNEDQLNLYTNSQKTIFLDITADWCITCKVNKMLVLDSDKFKLLVQKYDIILMRADWTQPNRDITLFMKKFDRYGIPFNAVFNPANPRGLLFSELLTINKIEDKLIPIAY